MNTPTNSVSSKVSHVNGIANAAHNVMNAYKGATKGLQNYGANVRKNIEKNQAAFNGRSDNSNYYGSTNPFPNPFKASSYKR